jgi:predicted ester cyclase
MATPVERVRTFLETLNGPNWRDAYDGLFDPSTVRHGFGSGGDLDEILRVDGTFFEAFPDHHREIKLVFGDERHVCSLIEFSGTWQHDYSGFPPNGNRFRVEGMSIFRFEGDRIVEAWQSGDTVSLLRQLGIMQ